MPLTIENKFIAPTSPQELVREQQQHVLLKHVSPTGYAFNMPVTVHSDTIDLTDIPSGSTITASLTGSKKPVTLLVKDGVKVKVVDIGNDYSKVHVKTESGDHSVARGYGYFATNNYVNNNGTIPFNDPNFKGTSVNATAKIKEGTYAYDYNVGEVDAVYCRHLASIVLALRADDNPLSWKDSRTTILAPEAIPKIFTDVAATERKIFDIITGSEHVVTTPKYALGETLRLQLMSLSEGMPPNEIRELKYYVSLNDYDRDDVVGHACALVLRSKSDNDGNITHKIKMYDPNLTYNHVSFTDDTPDLSAVKNLMFNDLFPLHEEYKDLKSLKLYELNPEWDNGVTQIEATDKGSRFFHDYTFKFDKDELELTYRTPVEKCLKDMGFKKVEDKTE